MLPIYINIQKIYIIHRNMAKKYILLEQLSIASELLDFVNNELLPGTGVTKEKFWNGLSKCAHELAPKNRKLLEFRENLQKKNRYLAQG